ncbi:hypothetical protein JMA_38500 (plasmid) [Jeotgalibacillus malaysiensis]|uniref:Uncharacterized protein n=1 Tax=Jeotgalibacillus malaysiensis TaxID=1508404 RepID=A0A0B5AX75_9BACL|nr:hypothetical protein [Jeotgalibacillus malaysiensis]AJD93168.1 hypothetical protein JMA_38500 [Jeotgalibacillus malaysiensis]
MKKYQYALIGACVLLGFSWVTSEVIEQSEQMNRINPENEKNGINYMNEVDGLMQDARFLLPDEPNEWMKNKEMRELESSIKLVERALLVGEELDIPPIKKREVHNWKKKSVMNLENSRHYLSAHKQKDEEILKRAMHVERAYINKYVL